MSAGAASPGARRADALVDGAAGADWIGAGRIEVAWNFYRDAGT